MAVTYHAGNILRGTTAERTGGTWTNLPAGWIYIESDGLAIYRWSGSAWAAVGGGGGGGASTSSPNTWTAAQTFSVATSLAGITGGDVGINNTNSPYTVPSTVKVVRADASSGAITINLPTAVGIAGTEYHIFRTDITQSTNIITIDANSTETIDSNLTYLLFPAEWVKLESDGANWQVLDRPTPSYSFGYYIAKGSTLNRRYVAAVEPRFTQLLTSTTAPTLDMLYAMPLVVARTTKFDTISFLHTTNASAGGVARAGIYYDNGNNYPGALIFDTGSKAVDAGSGTITDTTITSSLQVFQPGLYWLAWECGTAAPQIRAVPGGMSLMTYDGTLSATGCGICWRVSHTFGSLPNPYTASATMITTGSAAATPIPVVGLRAV